MFPILFAIALVCADPTTNGFVKLPIDLIMPIVSNIASYEDLVALNKTSKAFFPLLRPIFDFTSACQVEPSAVWANRKLEVGTDLIIDKNLCATHLMLYSSLYRQVSLVGLSNTIAGLLSQITKPLRSSVNVILKSRSLNIQSLKDLVRSIKYGSIHLDLSRQTINLEMVDFLASTIDSRTNTSNPIIGVLFDGANQILPNNVFANFFDAIPFSYLERLSVSGLLYPNAVAQLATVLPQSKLVSFEYSMPFVIPPVVEMEALGSALVRTRTMKQVIFRFFPSTKNVMASMISEGLAQSNIEVLTFIFGVDIDSAIALIKTLPPSLRVLDLSCNNIQPNTIVGLIDVVSRSNVTELNLVGNHARLSLTDVLQMRDSLGRSRLKYLNLGANIIDAEGRLVLAKVQVGRDVIF